MSLCDIFERSQHACTPPRGVNKFTYLTSSWSRLALCWFSLLEEQETLIEEHSRKTEELQWQNDKLKAQRNNIQNDLEKAKRALKALEGADEHGTHTQTHTKHCI